MELAPLIRHIYILIHLKIDLEFNSLIYEHTHKANRIINYLSMMNIIQCLLFALYTYFGGLHTYSSIYTLNAFLFLFLAVWLYNMDFKNIRIIYILDLQSLFTQFKVRQFTE